MSTQPETFTGQATSAALTRNWDMMLRTRDGAVHLGHASDGSTLTSTNILLDRTPLVEGGDPMLRDTLLVLTTAHRHGAYETRAGVLIRQQFTSRTVLIHPRTVTALARSEGDFTADGLTRAHEVALDEFAARFHDEPGFRDRFTA